MRGGARAHSRTQGRRDLGGMSDTGRNEVALPHRQRLLRRRSDLGLRLCLRHRLGGDGRRSLLRRHCLGGRRLRLHRRDGLGHGLRRRGRLRRRLGDLGGLGGRLGHRRGRRSGIRGRHGHRRRLGRRRRGRRDGRRGRRRLGYRRLHRLGGRGIRRDGLRGSVRHGSRRRVARGQDRERVDVAVVVRGRPHAEVDVRFRHFWHTARADRPDDVSLAHDDAAHHVDRAQVRERDGEAVGRLDRQALAARRHRARERDRPGPRRAHGPTRRGRAHVNAAVLAARVGVAAEDERAQHRSVGRPGPGAGGGCAGQSRDQGGKREASHGTAPLLSVLRTSRPR